jgi:ADP-heptose:LPS heptosyltransferase
MTKILFITCSRIGDAVLTTSVLNYINQHIPNARVTVVVDPLPAPLFANYPLLDQLIVLPKQKRSKHWLTLWKQVKNQRWNWVIDLRGSVVSYTLRCRRRSVWRQKNNDSRHKVEQIMSLVNAPITAPCLWFSQEQVNIAKDLLKSEYAYLAMAPAANWVGKQWPIERFTELAERFCADYPTAKILLIAAPHEYQIVQPFIKTLPANKLINLLDYAYDLGQIAAFLKQCQLFMGNDSGLMHMSAAVGAPTIGLFGPSREENYGPYDSHLLMKREPFNTVIRIPKTYDELKKTAGFSHQSQECYMNELTTDDVWPILKQQWERFGFN